MLLAGAPFAHGAAVQPVTYYLQLVRGSDSEAPPSPQARAIGQKLDQRLRNIFRWKNYWEIKRETATIRSGAAVRTKLSADREVEIAWHTPHAVTVSIYTHGKVTRRRTQSIDTAFSIAGGDSDASQSWFIIVRRDNPDGSPTTTGLAATP